MSFEERGGVSYSLTANERPLVTVNMNVSQQVGFICNIMVLLINVLLIICGVLIICLSQEHIHPLSYVVIGFLVSLVIIQALASSPLIVSLQNSRIKIAKVTILLTVSLTGVALVLIFIDAVHHNSQLWFVWCPFCLLFSFLSGWLVYQRINVVLSNSPSPARVDSMDFSWGIRVQEPSVSDHLPTVSRPPRRIRQNRLSRSGTGSINRVETDLTNACRHTAKNSSRRAKSAPQKSAKIEKKVPSAPPIFTVGGDSAAAGYRVDGHPEQCPICLDRAADRLTGCGHLFCAKCLDLLKEKKPNDRVCCPSCRAIIKEVRQLKLVVGEVVGAKQKIEENSV